MDSIKAGDMILATIPELKISLVRVKVAAVTNLPGKMIAVELPEPKTHHDCDGLCRPKQGWWLTPENIVAARTEDEAKRMLAEAAKMQEQAKPKAMMLKLENGQFKLVDAVK
jgi:hypothetical protein